LEQDGMEPLMAKSFLPLIIGLMLITFMKVKKKYLGLTFH